MQVRISKRLAQRVDKAVQERKYGYKTTTALVQNALELHLKCLGKIDKLFNPADLLPAVRLSLVKGYLFNMYDTHDKGLLRLRCFGDCASKSRSKEEMDSCLEKCNIT